MRTGIGHLCHDAVTLGNEFVDREAKVREGSPHAPQGRSRRVGPDDWAGGAELRREQLVCHFEPTPVGDFLEVEPDGGLGSRECSGMLGSPSDRPGPVAGNTRSYDTTS